MKNLIPYLRPPGLGIFTVSAAKDRKNQLFSQYYKTTNVNKVNERWKDSLKTKTSPGQIYYLGIPSDCGGGILRGSNWGPFHLRTYLIDEYKKNKFNDLGDVPVIPHLLHDKYLNKRTIESCQKELYSGRQKKQKRPVSPLSILDLITEEFFSAHFAKNFLFSVGGDHSLSYPVVKNILKQSKKNKKRLAIIHFDAHTDLSESRLGIDYCFGTWAYHILPYLKSPQDLIQFGIRSSGKTKSYWQKKYGIQQFWSKDLAMEKLERVLKKTKNYLAKEKIDYLYLSFDIDALDSTLASSTGTPEPEGLSLDTCLYIIEELASQVPLISADLMELAPNIINLESSPSDIINSEYKTFSAAQILTKKIFSLCKV